MIDVVWGCCRRGSELLRIAKGFVMEGPAGGRGRPARVNWRNGHPVGEDGP